jgi:hypothetical protein
MKDAYPLVPYFRLRYPGRPSTSSLTLRYVRPAKSSPFHPPAPLETGSRKRSGLIVTMGRSSPDSKENLYNRYRNSTERMISYSIN